MKIKLMIKQCISQETNINNNIAANVQVIELVLNFL